MNSSKYGCGPFDPAHAGQDGTRNKPEAGRHRPATRESQDREKGSTLWFTWRRPIADSDNAA